jgi:hypothetical protein
VAIYSRGQLIQTLTANAASLEFNCNNTERGYLLKVRITLEGTASGGGSSMFGFGQPVNAGQGQTWLTSTPEDASGLADVFPNIATSWSGTPPTAPTQFFRRSTVNAVGDEILWLFPYGLIVPSASSLVLWNLSTVGSAEVTLTWDD